MITYLKWKAKNTLSKDEINKEMVLKVLTPSQMPSRLPISLAQLKAENNSGKHKNEIRQLFVQI